MDEKPVKLEGEAAIALWKQGKDAWNKWVENNPNASVDFSRVSFIDTVFDGFVTYDFSGFNFPTGNCNFSLAQFKHSLVSFSEATFYGPANFSNVKFIDGACFDNTCFQQNVTFRSATFSKRSSFDTTTFASEVSFFRSLFEGEANFINAKFGGTTYFREAKFHNSAIFSSSSFEERSSFELSRFSQLALFNNLIVDYDLPATFFSFKGASFNQFIFSGDFTNCLPDLTATQINHQASLSGLRIQSPLPQKPELPKHWQKGIYSPAPTKPDNLQREKNQYQHICISQAESWRRLKELAENNRAHNEALAFNAGEMRSLRYQRNKSAAVLDWLFDFVSNYGQSLSRPLSGLVLLFLFMSAVFFFNGDQLSPHTSPSGQSETVNSSPLLIPAAYLSAYQTLPFLPISHLERKDLINELYKEQRPKWFGLAVIIQSGLSFVLLFLLGLGLRNRFRI